MTRVYGLLPVMIIIALLIQLTSAAAAEVPSIDEEITVPGWWVVGPFLGGSREAGTSGLAFDRDAVQFDTPLLRPEYPSSLIPGGVARWRWYESDENGRLNVDYPEVTEESMELVTDEWGFAGANTYGYAFATIHVEDGPRRALLDLHHAGGVTINGMTWPGDPYGHGMGLTPVLLDDGDNELKVGIGARQGFTLKFMPVEDDLIAFPQSATLPDLVRGEEMPQHFGLPLANTTNDWLFLERTGIAIGDWYSAGIELDAAIAPLCVYNLPMSFPPGSLNVPESFSEDKLTATITVSYSGGSVMAEVELDVRGPDEARRVTFISDMDLSVQYYGLLPPSDFDPDLEYGLILSLHGAGVEGIGQAKSYRPKDWAFVAAPTNRRRFGFDWQDWGQQDMLEVLAQVQATRHIDEDRIHLTGHSMGGHGTWYNGLTFPDKWATISPSAGWTRFDLYSPMFLRRNLLYGEPKANYIWQLAMRKDDTLALAENALNLPVYAVEGGADDNVPPQQPRLMCAQLKRLGYDVTYEEVPGMGHWWNDPDTEGTDCVDSDEHNAFWESHVRDPWPKQVVFKTSNYSINDGAYWVKGVPRDAGQDMVIRAEVIGDAVKVETSNVLFLTLNLGDELLGTDAPVVRLNGKQIRLDGRGVDGKHWVVFSIHLDSNPDAWPWMTEEMIVSFNYFKRFKEPYPAGYGSWKGVLYSPCSVAAGVCDDPEENKWTLHLARLYAYHWWYRANGTLPVVTTRDLGEEYFFRQDPGRPWKICIGGPQSASAFNFMLDGVIDVDPDAIRIRPNAMPGDKWTNEAICSIPADDLSYKATWILGSLDGNYAVLIEGGTSIEGLKRLSSMMGIYSGAGMPDWMVWDDEVQLRGFGGVAAMGFYDLDWQIGEDLTYINYDLINRLE